MNAFAPTHTSRVHSLGISYVYLKTGSLLTLLFLLFLTHVYHLLDHRAHFVSFSFAKLDTTKLCAKHARRRLMVSRGKKPLD